MKFEVAKLNLNTLLEYLSTTTGILINLHDVSGILSCPPFDIERRFKVHTLGFCDIAKSTHKGFLLCTSCKNTVCKMALRGVKPFFGVCPYGLLELVYPIKINNRTECMLFLGNTTENLTLTAKKAEAACRKTDVDFTKLSEKFGGIKAADRKIMLKTAEITKEFISLAYHKNRRSITYSARPNKIAEEMKLYADEYFDRPLTLKKMSGIYFMNEKYLGRLFINQIGQTFHSYINMRRLESAENLLRATDKTVLEISLECGFNSISYFNREFMKTYGKTPSEYRKI